MLDLNTLVAATDPLYGLITLTDATAINDIGQIVANSGSRAYLLTPVAESSVPEPATLALLGVGAIGVAGVRRRIKTATGGAASVC